MGDQLLTCNGVSFTNRGYSSVLIWDAKTWSTKKRGKVWKLFRKQNCHAALNRSWTVYKRWVTKSWPTMELASLAKSLPQSWSLRCKDLVHQKKKKEKKRRRVWKLFQKQDCLAVLKDLELESWKRWVTKSWPTMEAALPTESLPQFWFEMLRLGPPKKWEACETHFGNRTVLLR